jgi:ABC-2 type transport system permease protein
MSAETTAAGAAAGHGTGVIHDIGYQSYDGPRLGRPQIMLALGWHSLKSAFGIGRGAKAKIVPVFTFAVMCAPAVVNAIQLAVSGTHTRVVPYDTYRPVALRVLVLLIFLAAQAPEVVSRDLRSHVLPLYFARPIRRADYPLAKLAAFFAACLVLIEVPLLILYVGTVTQVGTGSAVWSETRALIPGLLLGLAWAAVAAALGLLFASFSSRRAYATGSVAIFFFLTWTLALLLTSIGEHAFGPGPGQPPALARLAGLISPFTALDGMRQWLGGTSPGPVPDPGSYGALYGIAVLAFLVAGAGGLLLRYRKVGVA